MARHTTKQIKAKVDTDLQQARRASWYATLSAKKQREIVLQHAWHCVCHAQAKVWVRRGQYGKRRFKEEQAG